MSLAEARRTHGPELTDQQARQLGILDQSLNAMIERALVDQDVAKLGINVSDQALLARLAALPNMRNKDGSFNKDLLRQMLYKLNKSEAEFFTEGKQDLARRQLVDALTSLHKVPAAIVDSVYRARGQKRVFDIVTVRNDSFADIPAPSDKALHDYYDQNGPKYTAPEYRALTTARLSTDDVAKDIVISDDQLKKEFAARQAEAARTGQRDAVQVVLHDEAKAQALASAAKKSGNLTASAKGMGLEAVTLDLSDTGATLPELVKGVAALKEGQVSDAVKSSLGWHVVQIKKPDFDSTKDELRADMKRDQAIDQATKLVNQLDDQLAAGHALEDIADGMRLRLVKIPAVDANGKTPDGTEPPEFPDRVEALKAAFGQNAGETSPIIDDHSGNYVVVRTDQVTPTGLLPFDKVKERVAADWKADEQAKRATAEADKIVKALRDGKSAASFAGNGIETHSSKPISLLGDSDPSLPQVLVPQILKMKKGEAITVPMEGRQMILRLADFVDVDPAAGGDVRGKLANDLAGQMPGEITGEYLKYLHMLFPVDVNQSLLDTLRQQGGG
jgi:peptidyl-prolyl cis-trans isomerase D